MKKGIKVLLKNLFNFSFFRTSLYENLILIYTFNIISAERDELPGAPADDLDPDPGGGGPDPQRLQHALRLRDGVRTLGRTIRTRGRRIPSQEREQNILSAKLGTIWNNFFLQFS